MNIDLKKIADKISLIGAAIWTSDAILLLFVPMAIWSLFILIGIIWIYLSNTPLTGIIDTNSLSIYLLLDIGMFLPILLLTIISTSFVSDVWKDTDSIYISNRKTVVVGTHCRGVKLAIIIACILINSKIWFPCYSELEVTMRDLGIENTSSAKSASSIFTRMNVIHNYVLVYGEVNGIKNVCLRSVPGRSEIGDCDELKNRLKHTDTEFEKIAKGERR